MHHLTSIPFTPTGGYVNVSVYVGFDLYWKYNQRITSRYKDLNKKHRKALITWYGMVFVLRIAAQLLEAHMHAIEECTQCTRYILIHADKISNKVTSFTASLPLCVRVCCNLILCLCRIFTQPSWCVFFISYFIVELRKTTAKSITMLFEYTHHWSRIYDKYDQNSYNFIVESKCSFCLPKWEKILKMLNLLKQLIKNNGTITVFGH